MNKHPIGTPFIENTPHPQQDITSNVGQILTRLHKVKVKIRFNAKEFQNLVEHLAVLCSYADLCFDTIGSCKGMNDWGHFDGFGSCAKYG